MIIGIDASRANTEHRTGTEWYSWHVIQELKQIIPAEHTVRLYVKEEIKADLLPLPQNWEVRVLQWRPRLFWTQLRLSIEMLLHSPDVLYVPAHTIPIIAPRNTVTVIHDVGFFTHPELYKKSELRYHRFSFHLAIKKAREIITISDFSRQEILKIAPQVKNRLRRIYNGLHVRNDQPEDSILDTYTLRDKIIILTISRVEEKKNSRRLVEAFAAYAKTGNANAVLVLAGGLGFGAEAIKTFVAEQGLQDRIIFTDYISDPEIVSLLMSARVFVFPSLYEGFGMPILEAMYYSIPVICSDISPLREIAGTAAEFFDPQDTAALTQTLARMIDVPDPIQAFAPQIEAGKKQAEAFSWKKTAEESWRVIEQTVL